MKKKNKPGKEYSECCIEIEMFFILKSMVNGGLCESLTWVQRSERGEGVNPQ